MRRYCFSGSGYVRPLLLCFLSFFIAHCAKQPGPNLKEVKKYYTKTDYGKWEKEVHDHTPRIEVDLFEKKFNILVYVILDDSDENHYIEKVGIMDENEKVIQEFSFGRGHRDSFYARFTLYPVPFEASKYKVFAKCNLHDLWVSNWQN